MHLPSGSLTLTQLPVHTQDDSEIDAINVKLSFIFFKFFEQNKRTTSLLMPPALFPLQGYNKGEQ